MFRKRQNFDLINTDIFIAIICYAYEGCKMAYVNFEKFEFHVQPKFRENRVSQVPLFCMLFLILA